MNQTRLSLISVDVVVTPYLMFLQFCQSPAKINVYLTVAKTIDDEQPTATKHDQQRNNDDQHDDAI